jgi:glycerol uptake facilitator-like aquaporin
VSVSGGRAGILRRTVVEGLGTAFLLAAIVGSGVMGERLFAGDAGLALLANSIATGATLFTLITCLGPLSGAHFNPAVSIAEASRGALSWRNVPFYVVAQIAGALLGVVVAHAMFELAPFGASSHERAGVAQLFSELVATFGLLIVIRTALRFEPRAVAPAVALYITAAYWFTASTSFANPAVTLARGLTNTFAGIRLDDVPGFMIAQLIGAAAATVLGRWLLADEASATPVVSMKAAQGGEEP